MRALVSSFSQESLWVSDTESVSHSLTQWVSDWLTESLLTLSLTEWLTVTLTDSESNEWDWERVTLSLTLRLTPLLTDWQWIVSHWVSDWERLTEWVTECRCDWLTEWVTECGCRCDWLTDCWVTEWGWHWQSLTAVLVLTTGMSPHHKFTR